MSTRLTRYEQRTSAGMVALALIYLSIYATQVLWRSAPDGVNDALGVVSLVIWAVFACDLAIRIWLADRKWSYVGKHPLDVVAVIVPMFRALRVLRVFTAGQWLISRGRGIAAGRTIAAIVVVAAFIAIIGALAFYDAEYDDPESGIDSFGDALWWAIVTMSTVGYGDVYPVTTSGRIVAAALMVVGISLLGVVTATVASWAIEQTRINEEEQVKERRRHRGQAPTAVRPKRLREQKSVSARTHHGR